MIILSFRNLKYLCQVETAGVQKVKSRALLWQDSKWPKTENMDKDGFSAGLACCIDNARKVMVSNRAGLPDLHR
jgi:hypothetical protein